MLTLAVNVVGEPAQTVLGDAETLSVGVDGEVLVAVNATFTDVAPVLAFTISCADIGVDVLT